MAFTFGVTRPDYSRVQCGCFSAPPYGLERYTPPVWLFLRPALWAGTLHSAHGLASMAWVVVNLSHRFVLWVLTMTCHLASLAWVAGVVTYVVFCYCLYLFG